MTETTEARPAQAAGLGLPLAVPLEHAEPRTPQWFAQRREGITATDVPKILGLSKYGNALSVFLDKRGELPDEEAGEAAYWGTVLEDPIARRYASTQDVEVVPVGVTANLAAPWMRCSLDRLVYDAPWDEDTPGRLIGALEVKNRNAFVAGVWSHEVPDDVLAQVQWQLMVTGLDWIDVAVLLGGNRLAVHRVTLDPQVAAYILTETTQVWQHVLDGTPPPVDADAGLLRLLEQLYPDRAGVTDLDVDDADTAEDWLRALDEAKDRARAAKTDIASATAGLVQLLGEHEHAAVGGEVLFSYATRTRRGHTVAPSTYRTLVVNRSR